MNINVQFPKKIIFSQQLSVTTIKNVQIFIITATDNFSLNFIYELLRKNGGIK